LDDFPFKGGCVGLGLPIASEVLTQNLEAMAACAQIFKVKLCRADDGLIARKLAWCNVYGVAPRAVIESPAISEDARAAYGKGDVRP